MTNWIEALIGGAPIDNKCRAQLSAFCHLIKLPHHATATVRDLCKQAQAAERILFRGTKTDEEKKKLDYSDLTYSCS